MPANDGTAVVYRDVTRWQWPTDEELDALVEAWPRLGHDWPVPELSEAARRHQERARMSVEALKLRKRIERNQG